VKNCVVNRRDLGYWYNQKILRILNIINKKTDYFLVNSEAVKRVVAENEFFPIDRIKVIYNAIWEEPDPIKKKADRDCHEIPTGSKIVGIIANLRPVKRIDRFLLMARAVNEKLPDTHFLILGGGELEKELKQQAEDIELIESVHFLGSISNVQSYLEIFDVGVLTSESEGLSNTLIEYARAGVPMVAFDVGGNGEIIKNGINGELIPDGDINRFAAAVVGILTDNEIEEKYSGSGKQIVDELFTPKKILQQTMEFYRTIVAENEKV
jgi:glycosyltransferase involved in cell wall biosynthesis